MQTPGPMFELKNVKKAKLVDNSTSSEKFLVGENIEELEADGNTAGSMTPKDHKEAPNARSKVLTWVLEHVMQLVIGLIVAAISFYVDWN